jgi:RNA recognition motif-containing protein
MGNKLYVGNLSWGIDTDQLHEIFAEHGDITDAIVLTDRDTGRSRGFGFVTFASADMAQSAIEALDGVEIDGRPLRVNEARERQDRGDRGPRRGGGGGFRR